MAMNNRDVAHSWAHQSSSKGTGSNFFFEGATIYSYGRHFPIARVDGNVVWFTTEGYSVTTTTHKGLARSAIPASKTVVFVPDVRNPASGIEHYSRLIDVMAKRKRTEKYWRDMAELSASIANYARVYPDASQLCFSVDAVLSAIVAARQAKQAEKLAQIIADWHNGDRSSITVKSQTGRDYLRIMPSDMAVVETSQGVKFAVNDAIFAWVHIKDIIVNGLNFVPDFTIKFGNFKVDRISSGDIFAGCHHIDRMEVIRFAASIGLPVETTNN